MYVRKFVSREHGPREHYLWVCTEKGWCSVGAEVVLLSVGLLIIINIVIVAFPAGTLKWWPGYSWMDIWSTL